MQMPFHLVKMLCHWHGHRAGRLLENSRTRVPGLFVPKTFRSQERIVPMGNFRSRDFSFPGTKVPWNFRSRAFSFSGTFVPRGTKVPGNFRSLDLSFRGTFVPRTFCSQELSFLRLFYKALAMNADSYTNCQNLFRSIT